MRAKAEEKAALCPKSFTGRTAVDSHRADRRILGAGGESLTSVHRKEVGADPGVTTEPTAWACCAPSPYVSKSFEELLMCEKSPKDTRLVRVSIHFFSRRDLLAFGNPSLSPRRNKHFRCFQHCVGSRGARPASSIRGKCHGG